VENCPEVSGAEFGETLGIILNKNYYA